MHNTLQLLRRGATGIALLLLGAFTACNNLNELSTDTESSACGTVRFCIAGYESTARTIVPTSADKENLYFTLKGKKTDTSDTLATLETITGTTVEKMAYSVLQSADFRLDSGNWTFALTGYTRSDSGTEYTELVSGDATANITAGEDNTISFTMTPVETGKGSVKVTMNYDLGTDTQSTVTSVVAKLTPIGETPSDEPTDTWESTEQNAAFTVTQNAATGAGSIVYTKADIDCGTYLLTFTVTASNSTDAIPAQTGCRSDVVIIAAGSESAADVNLKLNQVYTITYANEDTTDANTYWKEGYTPPLYFSPYESTALPTSENMNNASAAFVGWYTDAGAIKIATDIGVTKPMTYYAKWQSNAIFVSATGNDANDGTHESPYKTIATALTKVTDATLDWTIYVIGTLTENVTISTTTANSITLEGVSGSSTDVITAESGSVLTVITTTPVVLKKLTVTGGTGSTVDTGVSGGGNIYVNKEGVSLTIGEDAVIQEGSATRGGGVYVNLGSVTLNGGTITKNGTASQTSQGGGVYVTSSGSFTLASGTISENGLASVLGGGIYNAGTLSITGGSISENKASCGAGVYSSSSSNGGTMMSGGSITSNTASGQGGGVYNVGGTFTLSGGSIGAENAANTASAGGGVYIANGTLTMTGGSISYNTAIESGTINGNGGGVYNAATFNMSAGTITKNHAGTPTEDENVSTESRGGGVYNALNATMNLSATACIGESITDTISATNCANYANCYGGGIYNAGSLTIAGTDYSVKGNFASTGGGIYTTSTLSNTGNVQDNGAEVSNGRQVKTDTNG